MRFINTLHEERQSENLFVQDKTYSGDKKWETI